MIGPLPETYQETRASLHRLATYVIAPARRVVNDQITLRSTPGGFGTPPFGPTDRRIRVEGTDLVVEDAGSSRREPITTLSAAGLFAGIAPDVALQEQFDVPPHGDLDAPLPIDAAAARGLAEWFAFAFDVVDELRDEAAAADDPTPHVRLWPEHFDAAIDLGAGDRRGTYGASPGDRHHGKPYLYASVWAGPPADPFWNAEGFRGAWLRYDDLLARDDRRAAALDFFHTARRLALGA